MCEQEFQRKVVSLCCLPFITITSHGTALEKCRPRFLYQSWYFSKGTKNFNTRLGKHVHGVNAGLEQRSTNPAKQSCCWPTLGSSAILGSCPPLALTSDAEEDTALTR